jgi:P pilus assembly chaperone PapD
MFGTGHTPISNSRNQTLFRSASVYGLNLITVDPEGKETAFTASPIVFRLSPIIFPIRRFGGKATC